MYIHGKVNFRADLEQIFCMRLQFCTEKEKKLRTIRLCRRKGLVATGDDICVILGALLYHYAYSNVCIICIIVICISTGPI